MSLLLSLLVSCSVHFDDPLLSAIVTAFSAGNPFTVADVGLIDQDASLLGSAPQSRADAEAEIARIRAAGGAPVLGLLPLRPDWLDEFGKPLQASFEPCAAIEVASAKISEFDYQCRQRGARAEAPARRACTLDHYGASLGLPGLRLVVMASLTRASPPANSAALAGEGLFHSAGGVFFSSSPR